MCIANGNSFVEIDFGFMNSDLVVQIKLVYIMNFGFITSCNLKCASVGMVVFRPFPIILHFPSFFFFWFCGGCREREELVIHAFLVCFDH